MPQDFTNDVSWKDWHKTFDNYLRNIPGRDGVPLSYAIRANDARDPTPQLDFLDTYVNMAPLQGESYVTDNRKVATMLGS